MTSSTIKFNGISCKPTELPVVFFSGDKSLAYVHNAKAGCTLALNFLFFRDHGYAYFDPSLIHASKHAFLRIGPDLQTTGVMTFEAETFTFVREPLQRFLSAFNSKIFSRDDSDYADLRDLLTAVHHIDLSPSADPARSCLAFAKIMEAQTNPKEIDRHFRAQYFNLGMDGPFRTDTIIRLDERSTLLAFLSRWVAADQATTLADQRLGIGPPVRKEAFLSDELVGLVRKIYAADYDLFYACESSDQAAQTRRHARG